MDSSSTPFIDDPGIPVLVEGPTDAIFLNKLNEESTGLTLTIREVGGIQEVLDKMVFLAGFDFDRMGVFLDIDDSSPNQRLNQVENKLRGHFDDVIREERKFIINGEMSIFATPVGLPDHEKIGEMGIEKHEIEDHPLALLLDDSMLVRRLSSSDVNSSEAMFDAICEIETVLDNHITEVNSGKLMLELASLVIRYEGGMESLLSNIPHLCTIDLREHEDTARIIDQFESMSRA